MRYKVVAFRANITSSGGAADVATQLATLISSEATGGWDYLRLETVETYIAGDSGCFGIGATQPRMTSHSVAVFRAN